MNMDMLPFKAGDNAEARSFEGGYKSAWFRCKINDMRVRVGQIEGYLEYVDFPDEEKKWTRLYQKHPSTRRTRDGRQIMIRPPFPQWYWESQIPEHRPKADVAAIVSDPWKVGDLVDWLESDCYWTGKITELLGDNKVKIALPEYPIGEGGEYEADCKDLRPALDWSVEKGWSVPLSGAIDKSWYVARLVRENPEGQDTASDERREEVQNCLNGSSDICRGAPDPYLKLSPKSKQVPILNEKASSGLLTLQSRSNSPISGPELRGASPAAATADSTGTKKFRTSQISSPDDISVTLPATVELKDSPPAAATADGTGTEKLRTFQTPPSDDTSVTLPAIVELRNSPPAAATADSTGTEKPTPSQNSSTDDTSVTLPATLEEAIMELEEVAAKVRGLKDLLESKGMPQSKTAKSSWRLLEKDASGKQK